MKLGLFLLLSLILSIGANAQNNLTDIGITKRFENNTLLEFVKEVEAQAPVRFYYDDKSDRIRNFKVSYNAEQTSLTQILKDVFGGPGLFFAIDSKLNVFITEQPVAELQLSKKVPAEKRISSDGQNFDEVIAFRERKVYEIGSKGSVTQNEYTLSGRITSYQKDEMMAGATVRVANSNKATTTDTKGNFIIKLSPGNHVLIFTSVGYKSTKRNVAIRGNGTLEIEMFPEVTSLQEVVIKSNKESHTSNLVVGSSKLNIEAIKIVPASLGEVDVLKAILTLPGVKSVGEASAGFNVRGGATDQNLITMDGATVYNPFHFFGFFSSFNPEYIQDVELFKGSVPAAFGGRLSSILKVTSREGDMVKFKGSAGIGLLTSRINLEGPIIKEKLSVLVGARTTYSNWIFDLLPKSSGYNGTTAGFSDVNASLDAHPTSRDRIKASGYYSKDESNLNTDTTFNYSNRNMGLEWSRDHNDRLSSTLNIGVDHFSYGNFAESNPATAYALKFSIDQYHFRFESKYDLNAKHSLSFGVNSIYYKVSPGKLDPIGTESDLSAIDLNEERGLESALFVEDNFEVTPEFSLSAGLRYSIFNSIGPKALNVYRDSESKHESTKIETREIARGDLYNTYHGVEPRLSLRYLLSENISLKAAYTVMRQYIHMISNSVSISPTDIWKLSDPNIKPQFGQQISLGFFNTFNSKIETSIEGYTKRIENYLDYKSGATLVLNPALEQDLLSTKGKAYGVEFMIKKPTGNFNGWFNYTYSRTFLIANDAKQGEIINRGEYYAASHDKPHTVNLTANQKLSRRFNFTLNGTYSTGRPVTVPIGVFYYGNAPKTLYSDRNAYRIPDYFRVDISFNLEGNHKVNQLTHNSWTFGVYNVTGRKNPYSVFFTSEGNVIKGYKLSVFGSAIPFINYNIRF